KTHETRLSCLLEKRTGRRWPCPPTEGPADGPHRLGALQTSRSWMHPSPPTGSALAGVQPQDPGGVTNQSEESFARIHLAAADAGSRIHSVPGLGGVADSKIRAAFSFSRSASSSARSLASSSRYCSAACLIC